MTPLVDKLEPFRLALDGFSADLREARDQAHLCDHHIRRPAQAEAEDRYGFPLPDRLAAFLGLGWQPNYSKGERSGCLEKNFATLRARIRACDHYHQIDGLVFGQDGMPKIGRTYFSDGTTMRWWIKRLIHLFGAPAVSCCGNCILLWLQEGASRPCAAGGSSDAKATLNEARRKALEELK
jgi:hypothetical protein